MTELVLIRGLPGSGKSTMARVLAKIGYEHHESDQFFGEDDNYQFDASRIKEAHEWCLLKTKQSMQRRMRIVVANTFTRHWEMMPYIDAAKLNCYKLKVIEADGEWKNVHGVPDEAIERMRARWEKF